MTYRGEPRALDTLITCYLGVDIDGFMYLTQLSDRDAERYEIVNNHLHDVLIENLYHQSDLERQTTGEQGLRIITNYLRRAGAPPQYVHPDAILKRGTVQQQKLDALVCQDANTILNAMYEELQTIAVTYGLEVSREQFIEELRQRIHESEAKREDVIAQHRTLN